MALSAADGLMTSADVESRVDSTRHAGRTPALLDMTGLTGRLKAALVWILVATAAISRADPLVLRWLVVTLRAFHLFVPAREGKACQGVIEVRQARLFEARLVVAVEASGTEAILVRIFVTTVAPSFESQEGRSAARVLASMTTRALDVAVGLL